MFRRLAEQRPHPSSVRRPEQVIEGAADQFRGQMAQDPVGRIGDEADPPIGIDDQEDVRRLGDEGAKQSALNSTVTSRAAPIPPFRHVRYIGAAAGRLSSRTVGSPGGLAGGSRCPVRSELGGHSGENPSSQQRAVGGVQLADDLAIAMQPRDQIAAAVGQQHLDLDLGAG